MEPKFLVFAAPDIQEAEIAEVEACLRSGWLGTGARAAAFEREFAAYKGVPAPQAAAVNSCTAALHVSMVAAGLEPGSEVITTPLTFCATVNSILHAGLTPVLADIDPITHNIDPSAIEAAITPRTRAIIPDQSELADLGIHQPVEPESWMRHARHLYTIGIEESLCGIGRDEFLNGMNASGVGTGVHYLSVAEHSYYRQRFGWRPEQWPNAMRIGRQTVSLPLSPQLAEGDVDRVVKAVRELLARGSRAGS